MKQKVSSLDEVSEKYRALYDKSEDGFTLNAERLSAELDKQSAESERLRGANEKLLTEKKQAEGKVSKGEKEELEALRAKEAERERKKLEDEGKYDELLKQERESGQKKLDKAGEREKHLLAELQREKVDNAILAEINAEKAEALLLMPHAQKRVEMVEEKQEDGTSKFRVVVKRDSGLPWKDDKGEDATVKDLIGEFKAHEVLGRAFPGHGGHGAGTRSAQQIPGVRNGKNPWSRKAGHFNLTEQMQLSKSSPTLAKQLQELAEAEA